MQTHIEQAEELKKKIGTAMSAMEYDKKDFNENEVLFRMDAIKGILIMAYNDVINMHETWKKWEKKDESTINKTTMG